MSSFRYLLVAAAVVAVLMGRAECRPQPQTPDASEAEVTGGSGGNTGGDVGFHPEQFGSVVGEVLTYTDSLTVSKLNKRKKQQEEQKEPSFSRFISGPAEASVGLSAGVSLVPSQAKVELVSSR